MDTLSSMFSDHDCTATPKAETLLMWQEEERELRRTPTCVCSRSPRGELVSPQGLFSVNEPWKRVQEL